MLRSVNCRVLLHHVPSSRVVFRAYATQTQKSNVKSPGQSTPEDIERYINMSEHSKTGFDPWARGVPLLDLHVPTPLSSLPKDTSVRDRLKFMRHGLDNKLSNVTTMFRIAKNRSFPWNPSVSPYSLQIFKASSTKPNTWLEPLRTLALDSYERINTAVATNDINTIRSLTDGKYKKRMLERMKSLHASGSTKSLKKKQPLRTIHTWRLHSLASPVQCVSIRGQQAHFGRAEPLFGTRWVVQACMKFDTWQSITSMSMGHTSAPEPKRVLEYLVFEKTMWYDDPWAVRDQLWEGMLPDVQSEDDS
ncbi:hypothetical protein K439DRAFT_1627444 [Ramaria rubella]|nr:hypothetical protein K439DRAFT_1627444 [Ramaria rubella]